MAGRRTDMSFRHSDSTLFAWNEFRIPFEIDVRIHGDDGLPFVLQNPNSPSAIAFEDVVKKIQNTLES